MSEKNEFDYDEDPELYDDDDEGTGDDGAYDGEAVDFIKYDPSQFELDEDFELEDDEE